MGLDTISRRISKGDLKAHYLKNSDLLTALASEGDDGPLWIMMHTLADRVAGRLKWFDEHFKSDCISAVTIVLMSKRRKFRPGAGKPFCYFTTIAYNGFLQEIRNAKKRAMLPMNPFDEGEPAGLATRRRIRA